MATPTASSLISVSFIHSSFRCIDYRAKIHTGHKSKLWMHFQDQGRKFANGIRDKFPLSSLTCSQCSCFCRCGEETRGTSRHGGIARDLLIGRRHLQGLARNSWLPSAFITSTPFSPSPAKLRYASTIHFGPIDQRRIRKFR